MCDVRKFFLTSCKEYHSNLETEATVPQQGALFELRLSHLPHRLTVVRRSLRFLYQKRLICGEDVRV